MAKSVAEKIGVKESMRAVFVDAPPDAGIVIESPMLKLKTKLTGKFDYIHLFVKAETELNLKFPILINHLEQTGMLWVSWPKGWQEGTDLDIKSVIKSGYNLGLVESKCISINSTWSALKFTWPKKNKKYNNSYGKLS